MSYQPLDLGSAANDGTGDTLRASGDKINDNFVEIYTLLGDGTSLSSGISATATVVTLTAPTISGVVGGTITSATITTLTGTTFNAGTLALAAGSITDSSGAISFGNENLTTTGSVTAASLDISGNVDIDGTLETDALTIDGVSLAETISDTVGAMVSSNTETNITVTYDDADNTLDFVIGTLNQSTSGNAATATALETARTIHGVSFDGTANIDLTEVVQDTVGAMFGSNTETGITATYQDSDGTIDLVIGTLNQDTTGNAATATALETARTIGGVSFDGSANINLPGVNTAGNQNTSGTAAVATVATTVTITDNESTNENNAIVFTAGGDVDGGNLGLESDGTLTYNPSTGKITATGFVGALTGDVTGDVTGNADTATALATARTIHGVSFDGTANIDLTEVVQDTVGAMFGSNTETGITVTYQDADGTIDLVVGTLNQDTTGTADKVTVTDSTANTNFPVTFHDESNALLDDTGALRYNPSTGTLLVPNLVVAGTTTQVDTVTMNAENAVIFEGATADDHETTLTIIDPTADRTQRLLNQSGYIPLLAAVTTTAITSTPEELNILDGATVVVGEINALDLGSTAVGTAIASKAVILDSNKDYTGIRNFTVSGELDAATGDFSGDVDVDGTLEADAITVNGTALDEFISDTVGAMVSSNTETGIAVTYQDADNTIDFALNAAQTTITSLLATDIKIGEDDQTKIDFETADTINFYAGNEKQLILTDGALTPGADNILDLGSSSVEFKDAYFDGTVTSDAFAGPLTGNVTGNVSGTAATVTGAAQTNITSLGTLTALTVDNVVINGATIGHGDDTDLMTVADGILTVAGEVSMTTLDIGGTNVTSTAAELNILDGVTSTAAELNVLDGITAVVGELNALDLGSTAVGTAIASKAVILDSNKDYTGIRNLTISGELDAGSLDISGDVDVDGTLEADAITVNGKTLTEHITDLVGGMVGSNTETGITVTFQDADNTLDFALGAAQTTITSLLATDIKIGEDDQTKIDFETADEIHFYAANAHQIKLVDGALVPVTDNDIDLGTSSLEFKNAFFDGTVTADAFAGPINGDLTGTLQTAAQGNVTSLGTLTALTVDNVVINGATIGHGDDTDLMTVADGILTVAGEVSMTTLDIGGTNVTSTAAELNILDGVTSTAAELNILDGVTSTAAELNALDGITAVVGELNALDLGSTAVGTAIASKAVILDSNKDYSGIRNLTLGGNIVIADAGTIGSASDADSIAIASDGVVTFSQIPVLPANSIDSDYYVDGSIDTAHIADNQITLAKMAGLARGKIIVGDASGDPSALAPGSNGQVLASDGTDLSFVDISVSSLAADNLAAGDAAVLLTTSSGNITIDAAANDSDIILKGTDGGADTDFLTIDGSAAGKATFNNEIVSGAVITSGAGLVIADAGTIGSASDTDAIAIGSDGDVTLTQDLELQHDGAILSFGANDDVTVTHVHNTGLLLNAAMVVQFRDSAINIGSPADGDLDINADDEIELNSTLIDVNGNLDVSGTIVGASTLSATTGTFSGILKTDDATEATSTTDGSLQTDGGLSVVKDIVAGDDIKLLSDAAVVAFGANSEITLTHVHDVGLTLTHVTAGDNLPVVLQLKSEEDIVVANEVIASIEFAAGDSDGTDGATVAAGIHAIAEDTFSASANKTKLVFTTGVSETAASSATAKATLSSIGDFTVAGDLIIKDGGTIGSASDLDAIAIASDGVVTMNQIPVFSAGINVSGGSIAGTLSTAAQGNITSLGTLTTLTVDNVVINGATIGHGDDTDLMTVADGILTVAGEVSMTTLDIGGTNVTSTAAELNALDGITAVVGELNALDLGSTAVGTAIASKAVILDSNKDYTGVRNFTLSGELDAGSLDVSGDVDIDGTLEADAITVNGTALAEFISDTAGAMVGSNTETGISVTYQDGDNTIDFALAAAQTTITSLLATDIKIGEDDQTKIDFETADEIHFYAANAHQIKLVDGALVPVTDNDVDLGTSSLEFKDAFFDGTVTSDAFAGPLTGDVTGTSSKVTVTNSTANTNFPVVFNDESDSLLDDTGALRYNPSSGTLLVPNLVVAGTTTQVDTVTMNAANAVVFEGATADAHETTLTIIDPTGDRTINLPNVGGTLPVLAAASTTQVTSTPEELNILDGATVVVGEINALDLGSTAVGNAIASKAVILDSNKDYTGMRNLTISGEIDAATGDFSGAVDVAGATTTAAITASGIIKTDDATEATSTTDGSLQTDGGLSVVKDAVFGDDIKLLSDAAVAAFGANGDVTLTHVHNTGLLLNAAMVVQFRDSAINIGSPADGDLDINADDEIELNSTLIDVNGNLDVSGTGVIAGALTSAAFTASGIIKTDDTTAATSTTDGSLQTDGGLSVAADAVIGDDLFMLSDAAVVTFGADKDVTLTHVADTGLLLNAAMVVQFRDSAINIGSPADGDLDINADDEIELNSTLIDINGNLDVSGTGVIAGAVTTAALTASGIIKTDDTTAATSTTDGSLQTDGGLSVVLDAVIGDDIILISDAAQIAFGVNSEITLAHVHNVGLTLTHATAGDNLPIVLQLKSEEDIIVANEVIASIEFAAGDSDGTDGATVAAGIHAIAEDTFSASANATKLVFTTGVSETAASSATAKMTLSSAGLLTIADDFVIKDGGTIGVASDADSMTIASNGVVTFSQIPLLPDNTVKTADIADDQVTQAKMANDSVGSAEMKTLSTLLIKNSGGTTLKTLHAAGA